MLKWNDTELSEQARYKVGPGFGDCHTLALSPIASHIAIGNVNGDDLSEWDFETNMMMPRYQSEDGLARRFTSAAFSRDGKRLVTTTTGGYFVVWDTSTRSQQKMFRAIPSGVGHVSSFSDDGTILMTASVPGTTDIPSAAKLWRVGDWSLIVDVCQDGRPKDSPMHLSSVAMSGSGATVALGDLNGNLYLWH